MSTIERLARERALKKRRRERRLAEAYDKHDRAREKRPLQQGMLDLRDKYISKRAWLEQLKREVFGDP